MRAELSGMLFILYQRIILPTDMTPHPPEAPRRHFVPPNHATESSNFHRFKDGGRRAAVDRRYAISR